MSAIRSASSLLLALAGTGCTRVVDLGIDQGPPRLVVDARLELRAGGDGRQWITLTTTDAIDQGGLTPPATGATVRVIAGDGTSYDFQELGGAQAGVYHHPALVPAVGGRYTLRIDWGGERFEATHELLPVVPIDSLYFGFEDEGIAQGDSGFRAVIDYTDPAGTANYYLWELVVNGARRFKYDPGNRFRIISEDRFYDGGEVVGYQPYDEEVVDPGQTVVVRQVSLSREWYRYFFALLEQTAGGGPFSVPPASVRGNVANLTDPARPALGFFGAAQVSERAAVVPPRSQPAPSRIP